MRRISLLCVAAASLLGGCSPGEGVHPSSGDVFLSVSPAGEDGVSFYLSPDESPSSAESQARDALSEVNLEVGEVRSRLVHDESLLRVRVRSEISERDGLFEHRISSEVWSRLGADGSLFVEIPGPARVSSSGRLVDWNLVERTYEVAGRGPITYSYSGPHLLAVLGAILLGLGAARVGCKLYVGRVRSGSEDPIEKSHKIQRMMFVVMLALPLGILAGIFFGGLLVVPQILLGELFPSAPEAVERFVFLAAFFLLLIAFFVVVLAPVQSYYRELRDIDQSSSDSRRRLIRGLVFGMAAPLIWIMGLTVLDSAVDVPGWLRVVLTVSLFVLILTIGPMALAKALGHAKLEPQLRERLLLFVRAHGVKIRDIRALKGRPEKHANALIAGVVPGFKYIFLTDYLVEEMDDDELMAIVAHEVGHAKKKHLLIKIGLPFLGIALVVGLMVLLAIADVLPDVAVPVFLMAMPVVFIGSMILLQGVVGLKLEHSADDFAKATVGLDPTVRALEKLAELNMTKRDTGRMFNLLAQHPSIDQRVKRLRRGRTGSLI